jgi:hypothetical protein
MPAQDSKLQFVVGKRTWAEVMDQLPDALESLPSNCESLRQLLQHMMAARPKPAQMVSGSYVQPPLGWLRTNPTSS